MWKIPFWPWYLIVVSFSHSNENDINFHNSLVARKARKLLLSSSRDAFIRSARLSRHFCINPDFKAIEFRRWYQQFAFCVEATRRRKTVCWKPQSHFSSTLNFFSFFLFRLLVCLFAFASSSVHFSGFCTLWASLNWTMPEETEAETKNLCRKKKLLSLNDNER